MLLNILVLSPMVSMLQVALTRRLMTAIYDDLTDSHMGYSIYYSKCG
jgi:hypothetical protein